MASWSQVKHSTTELLCSRALPSIEKVRKFIGRYPNTLPVSKIIKTSPKMHLPRCYDHMFTSFLNKHLNTRISLVKELEASAEMFHVSCMFGLQGHSQNWKGMKVEICEGGTGHGAGDGSRLEDMIL